MSTPFNTTYNQALLIQTSWDVVTKHAFMQYTKTSLHRTWGKKFFIYETITKSCLFKQIRSKNTKSIEL